MTTVAEVQHIWQRDKAVFLRCYERYGGKTLHGFTDPKYGKNSASQTTFELRAELVGGTLEIYYGNVHLDDIPWAYLKEKGA